MKKFEVHVNQETIDYLERLSFEVEGMRSVIKEMITDAQTNPLILDGEGFKAYNAKYEERHAKYEIAKKEMQDKYIPKKLSDENKLNRWDLDFKSGVLTFEVADDNYVPEEDYISEVK